jgi:DNA primase
MRGSFRRMRFNQDFIEKVRASSHLAEIIGSHTELKEKGDRLWGRCPFPDHNEKTPSFSVSDHQQLYYCFGCKRGGNVFTFLETYNGFSFRESIEFLARRASIPIPENTDPQSKRQAASRGDRELLLKINRAAGVFFYQQLQGLEEDHPIRKYVASRGLTPEIIEKFRIGVALEDWQALTHTFIEKNAPLAQAEILGLIKRRKTGTEFYDLFRERLMFPIFSPTGEVLGFGGRTYNDGVPKYLNSPETPLFSKGKVLYGLRETGKFIRSRDQAVVVEGYMDAIALYGAGIQNVVAILGTAFTADHAKLLKRYSPHVTMLLDGDEAGISAAERSLPILLQAGVLAKGCFLPDGLDPDDYVKIHGVAALQNEIEKAPDLFSLVLGRWMQGYRGTPSEKVSLLEQAYQVLKPMENRQLRELYMEELAQRLDVERAWVLQTMRDLDQRERAKRPPEGKSQSGSSTSPEDEFEGAEFKEKGNQAATAETPIISLKKGSREELFVLSLMLQHESLFKEALASDLLETLADDGVRQALAFAVAKYGQGPENFDKLAASLASQVDSPNAIMSALELIKETSHDLIEERNLMSDYMTAIRKRFLSRQAKVLANQLRDQSSPEKLEQFMNIQRNRLAVDRTDR